MIWNISTKKPNVLIGLGNNYDEVGRNIMDHHYQLGASAKVDGHLDKYYKGRRPNGFYIPRFVNLSDKTRRTDFLRSFGYQGGASKDNWGEMLSHYDKRVTLSRDKKINGFTST